MTERLYHHDSYLSEFDGRVAEVIAASAVEPRPRIVLDRTAFYPTSGGQVFDTGWISVGNDPAHLKVVEVADADDGSIIHFLEENASLPPAGTSVHGVIDFERRRDHMQQHTGQHVLSAAFIRLFNMPTVSFHMGDDYCSIDLDAASLSAQQVARAEQLANEVIRDNRPVHIRFVGLEEARTLGLRKIPALEKAELRLVDIQDFDLTACGGTHVSDTSQIGAILLRKTEKVRQGWRVEFVCGERAIARARADYMTLAEAGSLLSTQMAEVPQQIRKLLDDARAARKSREQLLEEIAELTARQMLADISELNGRKLVVRRFPDRDLTFVKLVAQRLVRLHPAVVALLAAESGAPALVFAQSAGLPFDMGAMMKETMSALGGRGGGSKDMAQGGVPSAERIGDVLEEIASRLRG
jgi:alanyl-tRNA synthetase